MVISSSGTNLMQDLVQLTGGRELSGFYKCWWSDRE